MILLLHNGQQHFKYWIAFQQRILKCYKKKLYIFCIFFARFWLKVRLEMTLMVTLPLMTCPFWTVNHMKVSGYVVTESYCYFSITFLSEFSQFQFTLLAFVFYPPLLQESCPNQTPPPQQRPPQPLQLSPTPALMESLFVVQTGSVLPTAKCVTSDKIVLMAQMN